MTGLKSRKAPVKPVEDERDVGSHPVNEAFISSTESIIDEPDDAEPQSQQDSSHNNGLFLRSALVLAVAAMLIMCWNNAVLQASIKDLQAKLPFDELPFFRDRAVGSSREPDQPGPAMAKRGLVAKYPVIIIPGFVTSALELWEGHECARGSFRQRMWTHLKMATSLLSSSTCWVKHLSLNFTTGLDPDGIRLRAAEGLDAVDYFFVGYAVWAKAIEALAAIGYDSTTMMAMPYDWRLSIPNMEIRDAYFTRLRNQVENFHGLYKEKVLLAAHSWGDNVARAFLHWMEEMEPGWVEDHIAVLVNVAGPTLGTPKAATALLSGEMKDTAQLGGLAYVLGEQLLCKEDRTLLWRTWGSSIGMLPIGGEAMWGNSTWAPDDTIRLRSHGRSFGAFLSVDRLDRSNATMEWLIKRPNIVNDATNTLNLTIVDAIAEIIKEVGPTYLHHIREWGSATLPADTSDIEKSFCPLYCDSKGKPESSDIASPDGPSPLPEDVNDFHFGPPAYGGRPIFPKHKKRNSVRNYDVMTTPLPNAPSLRIYCCYGYNISSERAYHYIHYNKAGVDSNATAAEEPLIKNRAVSQNQKSASADWEINRQAHNPEHGIENGVLFSDGDGTVPLISLGAMCEGGWRTKELNPHGVKIVTREYKNNMASMFQGGDYRGGPEASAHVEVLGNKHFLEDLLKIAAGLHDEVPDSIGSEIHQIIRNIEGWRNVR